MGATRLALEPEETNVTANDQMEEVATRSRQRPAVLDTTNGLVSETMGTRPTKEENFM